MYGFLVKAAVAYLNLHYHDLVEEILDELGFADHKEIDQFQIYSDKVFSRLSKILSGKVGKNEDELMENFGMYAIDFMCQAGYQEMLYSLGRSLSDLLNELDNLHVYIQTSYPKLKAPSFICLKESIDGITLLYRSRRAGFQYYNIGLLKSVAKKFYGTMLTCEITSTKDIGNRHETVYRLFFDNSSRYSQSTDMIIRDTYFKNKVILADTIFEIYPFHILTSNSMEIQSVGKGLHHLYTKILREDFNSIFEIIRPSIDANFRTISHHLNNIFEINCILSPKVSGGDNELETKLKRSESQQSMSHDLVLKGQMIFVEEWDCLLFIGFPIINVPEQLLKIGLFVSDLSLFDSSRDLVMVSAQDASDRAMTQKLVSVKSDVVAEATHIMEKAKEDWQRVSYSMMPTSVSQRLMRGEPAYSLATTYERATVVYFQVVDERFDSLLGEVFSHIEDIHRDALAICNKFNLYKVDGRLTEFMFLCGVPESLSKPEISACLGALALLTCTKPMIRVGIATGKIAVGIIGVKLMAYKPFGESVKIARHLAKKAGDHKIYVDGPTQAAASAEKSLEFNQISGLVMDNHLVEAFEVSKVSKGKSG